MTKKITSTISQQTPGWTFKSDTGHNVQFYKSDSDLILPLSGYVSSGLTNGEICIVIATDAHMRSLNSQLRLSGVYVAGAVKAGQYVMLDAVDTLYRFMVNGLPDRGRFLKTVVPLIEKQTAKGKLVRAYGEMVALLWKTGNKDAVIQLENLWNELAEKYNFSLFCAYPQLHFIMDNEARDEISDCHNASLYGFGDRVAV